MFVGYSICGIIFVFTMCTLANIIVFSLKRRCSSFVFLLLFFPCFILSLIFFICKENNPHNLISSFSFIPNGGFVMFVLFPIVFSMLILLPLISPFFLNLLIILDIFSFSDTTNAGSWHYHALIFPCLPPDINCLALSFPIKVAAQECIRVVTSYSLDEPILLFVFHLVNAD